MRVGASRYSIRHWGIAIVLAGLFIVAAAPEAGAVPSFSRQTGDPCAACHVGAFGFQLTPRGRQFKLDGYTDTKSDYTWTPPISGMAVGSFTHTEKKSAEPIPHYDRNDNFALDEASLFIAGKIAGPVGAFIQGTYEDPERNAQLDNVDIRVAHAFNIKDVDVTLGATINNNPTVQDLWNSTPAWGFPFASSPFAPEVPGTVIEGRLEQTVVGMTFYSMIANTVYVEAGGYKSLSRDAVDGIGIDPLETDRIKGTSPYWRVALQQDWGSQYASIGTFGLFTELYPGRDRSNGTDKFTDIGFDFTYQFLGTRQHILQTNITYIHEFQNLDASQKAGDAQNTHNHLNSFKINGSYYYDNTYGLTLGYFNTWGSHDALLFEDNRVDKPNTEGFIIQADFTPFGKEGSLLGPWANLRFAIQYTAYTKFNGSESNFDGSGRKASDNNTLFLYTWLAF